MPGATSNYKGINYSLGSHLVFLARQLGKVINLIEANLYIALARRRESEGYRLKSWCWEFFLFTFLVKSATFLLQTLLLK